MVKHCIAFGCVNRSNKPQCKGLSWHSLPLNDSKRLKEWLVNIRRTNTPVSKHSYLCSDNFSPECFSKSLGGIQTRLKPDAVPSKFCFSKETTSRKPPKDRSSCGSSESLRTSSSSLNSDMTTDASTPEVTTAEEPNRESQDVHFSGPSLQSETERKLAELKLELAHERQVKQVLEEKLIKNTFNIENVKSNDNLIKCYTGFQDYETFSSVLNFLGREATSQLNYTNTELQNPEKKEKRGPTRALTVENEFFLVLCRYKVGLLEEDLSVRFGISQSLVSRIIITWTKFMYYRFKELDIFPDRGIINLHKPECFKDKYKGTTVIIDVTELNIETPSNPEAQQLTFSTYKNSNTLKALVGITPSGSVCFVSQLYGGSISDKEITAKSQFMDKLRSGDEIMADRGFNIQELLAEKGVKVNVPPFMNESGQFTEQEMVSTRRIATLRIHVERAIERIKNYHILDFIPITICKNGLIDMIFFVCAMFTNFLPPLVK